MNVRWKTNQGQTKPHLRLCKRLGASKTRVHLRFVVEFVLFSQDYPFSKYLV